MNRQGTDRAGTAQNTEKGEKGEKAVVLRPEQLEAVAWMREREANGGADVVGGILADDVGKGKTYVVGGLIAQAPLWPTLVVVPKSTMWDWLEVLNRVTGEVPYAVASAQKHMAASMGFRLVLVTTAAFSGREVMPELRDRAWGRVVVDEAHWIRNPDTLAHRALAGLKAHAKWALTATPLHNGGKDLLALGRFLGLRCDDPALVRDRFVFRRVNADRPPPEIVTVTVPLTEPGERELYDEVHDGSVAALSDATARGDVRALERLLRCRQAATHPAIYHRSMAAKPGVEHADAVEHARLGAFHASRASSKLRVLYEDLEAHEDEKALVFCEWIEEMRIVEDFLETRAVPCVRYDGTMSVDARQNAVDRFRDPSVHGARVLVLQVYCAACGLNLQAATRVYLMRPQWNPAVEYQAIGRAHRSGQTQHVSVRRLVAEGTVDELMMTRQTDKLKRITGIMGDDAMERVLRGTDGITEEVKPEEK